MEEIKPEEQVHEQRLFGDPYDLYQELLKLESRNQLQLNEDFILTNLSEPEGKGERFVRSQLLVAKTIENWIGDLESSQPIVDLILYDIKNMAVLSRSAKGRILDAFIKAGQQPVGIMPEERENMGMIRRVFSRDKGVQ